MSEPIVDVPAVAGGKSFSELLDTPEFHQEWQTAREGDSLVEKSTPAESDEDREAREIEEATGEKVREAKPKAEEKPKKDFEVADGFEPKSEKGKNHWKTLKETHAAEKAQLQKELAEARQANGTATAEDLKTLRQSYEQEKQTRAQFEDQLKQLAVERHPKFKEFFDNKIQSSIAQAKAIVGTEHAARLETLLNMPDSDWKTKQLDEITESIGMSKGARLGAALNDYEKINGERQAEIGRWKERHEAMTAAERRSFEESKQQESALFDGLLKTVTDKEKGNALWRQKEGDAAWNTEVQERMELARAVYSGQLEPKDRANMALWAASAPTVLRQQAANLQRIAELEKENASIKAAKPGLGGSGRVDTSVEEPPSKQPDSFSSASHVSYLAQQLAQG